MTDKLKLIRALCREAAERGKTVVLRGHSRPDADSILSCVLMQKLLDRMGIPSRVCLDPERSEEAGFALVTLGIDYEPLCGEIPEDAALILLDHNAGSYGAEVLLAIDHHPVIGDKPYPVTADLTASSCAKIIYGMIREIGQPTAGETRIALCSVACDTLGLTSTKTAPDDIEWFYETCPSVGFDAEKLIRGSILLDDPDELPDTLCAHNFKRFDFPSGSAGTSQVKTDGFENADIPALLEAVGRRRAEAGYFIWNLSVCDPIARRTALYWVDRDGVHREEYRHTVSRSREIIPRLSEMSEKLKYIPQKECDE